MTSSEYLRLLRAFKQSHAGRYGITRIGIFGSVARGEQTENSDVDIFYEAPAMGLSARVGLQEELENLFGTRVDVVRRHGNLKPGFIRRIEKEVIYV
ncbi:MAG: nucleotidyltransferase family protein [Tannerella sp.]|jgi:predicted nucleotidyltransferase|nr:nucleotidyltransferase family protein [Tannerella sp.]MDR1223290.1 nucleotidyltransferase family protein [Tannerella sp.]